MNDLTLIELTWGEMHMFRHVAQWCFCAGKPGF